MQAYFNYDDARVEVDYVLNGNPREKYFANDFLGDDAGNTVKFIVLCVLLVVFVFTLKSNLSSNVPVFDISRPKMNVEHKFVIEIPEEKKEIPRPRPIPKKEIPKPKDRRQPTRRTMPEMYASTQPVEVEDRRDIQKDLDREYTPEKAVVRDIPTVETPVIEMDDVVARENVTQEARLLSAVVAGDTVRQYSYEGIVVRNAPAVEVSHSQLDPYHYQMVDLCLRLCAQSLFLRDMGEANKNYSYDWFKIRRSAQENILLFKYRGHWVELEIHTERLKMLSDLSFIEVPVEYTNQLGSLDDFVEEVTRNLCRVLKHEDCLENL